MLLRERGETDCIRRRVSFLQESKWKKESKTFFFSLVSQSQNQSEVAQLCPTLCDPMDTRLLRPWDLLGKSTGVGCHFLLQGIFSTQGSNAGLLHGRQMLYHLSHQGSHPMLLPLSRIGVFWSCCKSSYQIVRSL